MANLSSLGSHTSGVPPTVYERRQRIVSLLREQQVARVTELAKLLDVSEGTIRSDLRALATDGQVRRVRGGAALADGGHAHHPAFAARARVRRLAKERIARWAAGLVADGDVIFVDASTTVYYMARHLLDRRRLTVVTNGLEIAYALAENPTHTVILLGGVLRAEASSVSGSLSLRLLADLHIKTAFLSCSGFSLETGLTEVDLEEAQLKSRIMECADAVVVLADSAKFGRVDLSSFARPEEIAHLFTDSDIDAARLDSLQRVCRAVSVCDQNTVTSLGLRRPEGAHYRIGFANLNEEQPFAVDVRQGLEQAAREAGNTDLILADNRLDGRMAIEVAGYLIDQKVDLAIEYQIDEQAGAQIIAQFHEAGIPVIAVDIPMVGATFFGVENYRAGHMAGLALGRWVHEHWSGLDRLLVFEEQRAGSLPAARIRGQIDGVQEVLGRVPEERVVRLDSGNAADVSQANMLEALGRLDGLHRLAVISFNDDAAMGAIAAARRLGREGDIVIVGQGADRWARAEMRRPGSRLIGSTAYRPEAYGRHLIAIAQRILRQESVPPAVYIEHVFITPQNVGAYYAEEAGA